MDNAKRIWDILDAAGVSDCGKVGILANLKAESALRPDNAQDSGNRRLGMTDAEYTAAVDNGTYTNFVRDSIGYGLAQWTYWSRKQALLDFARARGCSIGDPDMQVAYLLRELASYGLLADIKASVNFAATTKDIMLKFERPANNSPENVARRVRIACEIAAQFGVPQEKRLPMPDCDIPWNQKQTSACVAFALTMAMRVKLYGVTHKWIDLDPLTLFAASGASGGASVSVLAETLRMVGVRNTVDRRCIKAKSCANLSGYEAIFAAIDAGNPVAIALQVDKSFGKRQGGIEPSSPKSPASGHAVCVIGYAYIDGAPYYVVKNSHGDPIRNGGIVYIPAGRTLAEAVAVTDVGTEIRRKAQTIKLTTDSSTAVVDGKTVDMPAAPYIRQDRLLVPVRAVADALGCEVAWDAAAGTATLTSEEAVLALTTHSPVMRVNGKPVEMDAAPEIVGSGTMMIPVRYIAEALRCKVAWEASTRTATITAI